MNREPFDPEKFMQDMAEIELTPEGLSREMSRHSALLSWYGVQLGLWEEVEAKLSLKAKTQEAQTDLAIREQFEEEGRKTTENLVKNSVLSDPEIIDINCKLIEVEKQVSLYKNAIEAFRHRRDMLISLGNLLRDELAGDISFASKARAKHSQIKERAKSIMS